MFSVAGCKDLLHEGNYTGQRFKLKWESWVPIKVNLIAWRAERDRQPTRVALEKRRVKIDNVLCPFCNMVEEDLKHLLVGCGFAYGVWSGICKWCKLDPFFAYAFDDLLMLYKNVHGGKWRKKIIRGIVMITTWVLWNARNAKIFQDKNMKVVEVVAEIKSRAFIWLKNRSKFSNIVRKDWASYSLYMCL